MLDNQPPLILVQFDASLDPSSVNSKTFRLEASGGDDTFDDGNEITIQPADVGIVAGTDVRIELEGVHLPDDVYRLTVMADASLISSSSDADARLMSMEISGELLPPPVLYEEIRVALTLIREAYPEMTGIRHRARWVPGELLVGLTPEAMDQFNAGQYHGLDNLNAEYGPVQVEPSSSFLKLKFEQYYNPEYLSPVYAAADGVRYASPNIIFGYGSDITLSGNNYTFSCGWDCQAGCINRHYWVFQVDGESVSLISEYGPALPFDLPLPSVMDLNGNILDGEGDYVLPLPVSNLPSGDGVPRGNFTASFCIASGPVPPVTTSINLQGSRPYPWQWEVPATVEFFEPGSDPFTEPAVYSFSGTTSYSDSPSEQALCRIYEIEPGTYDVTAKCDGTLMNISREVIITDPTTTIYMGTLVAGDCNNDNLIDYIDLGIVLTGYDAIPIDLDWNPGADLNANDLIDFADLGLVLGHYDLASAIEVP